MTTTATEEWTSVPTAAGDLRALTWIPEAAGPLPGIVLVDGSGDGACDDWGEWPERFVGCGAVVLAHDKPGCGGSPGNWLEQTFDDRARESLAALAVLRGASRVRRPAGRAARLQPGRLGRAARRDARRGGLRRLSRQGPE